MNKKPFVRYSIILMFLCMIFSYTAQAQYKLRFRAYENGSMCGCGREGVVASRAPNGALTYHYNAVYNSSTGSYNYEIEMAEDPRNHTWSYVHIPAVPSVCGMGTCSFVNAGFIPIYSGPSSCGTTYVDIPGNTNNIRGLYVVAEFSAPKMTTPTIVGGGSLDNICKSEVEIETTNWLNESYVWQVSRSVSGPWTPFDTTSGVGGNRTKISRKILGDALLDSDINGDQLQLKVRPIGPTACWFDRSSPPPSLTVFQNAAPQVVRAVLTPPTCKNGNDGRIEITRLESAPGIPYVASGNLVYTLTSPSGSVYNFSSNKTKDIFIHRDSMHAVPIIAGSWHLTVEGVGRTCRMDTNFVIAMPPSLLFTSQGVSQSIGCIGGTGAVSVSVNNGSAPYTYTLTRADQPAFQVTATSNLSSHTFASLLPGTYKVRVNSCSQVINSSDIYLGGATSPVAISSLTGTNVSCLGQTNGTLTLTASGGTSPYAVQVNGGTFFNMVGSSYTAGGLSSGTHQVNVRDANGCMVSGNVVVNTNSEIGGSIEELQSVTCASGNNGLVVLKGKGSTGVTFEYSLNGTVYQAINGFAGLNAGNYAVSIRDKNAAACRWDSTVVITEPLPIHIDEFVVSSPISCYDGSNGSLRASASGGTPQVGYTYNLLELTSGANDSRVSAGTVLFNNLSTGNYRLTVADGTANCFVTADLLLTEPSEVFFNPVLSDYHGSQVSCTASSDGSITVRSRGGIYPHRISVSGRADQLINSSGEAVVFDNFQSGDYFFTLSNNNGACQKDTLIRLLAPAPLDLSLSAQVFGDGYHVSCHGSNDGLVSASLTGGTMPFTYTISPSGNPATHTNVNLGTVNFSDLGKGTYTVAVTDANNCQLAKQYVLTEPEELTVANIIKSDIFGYQLTCHGDQDAEVTVFSQGGSYPHTLALLVGGQQGMSNSTAEGVAFSALGAGTYNFSIVDEEGCSASGSFDLLEPDALALDNSQTVIEKPNCAGEQTGSLHLQSMGGIGTVYTYQLTYLDDRSRLPFPYPEQQSQTGNPVDFDPLIAGSYMITVTDQVGCLRSEPLLISTNHQVSAQLTTTDITCKSDSDGSATLNLTGGVAPYHVSWLYQQQTLQADQDILENQSAVLHDLKEGLYTFEVSDANGCAYYTGNYAFQIEGPEEALSLNASVKPITCQGDANGTVILQAQGGWPQTAYLYGTDLTQLNAHHAIYENLTPGVYRYFTKDMKGCVDTLDVNMTEPAVLNSSVLSVDNVSCYGLSDGAFVLTITGGTMPYQLSLDEGTSWTLGNARNALSVATYEVIIKDSNACQAAQSVSVTQPELLQVILTNQQNTLCKQSTGAATVNVTGGTLPYSYSWTNNDQQAIGDQSSINMIAAGQYVFHVADDHSCAAELPVTIINTNDILFEVDNITGVTCYGEANGSAELSISAIQSPYSIQWDNGTSGTTAFNLAAGERSVVLEDANQCQVMKTFSVPGPEALSLSSVQKTSPGCYGSCNGQLSVQASGGTAPYQYSWLGNASIGPTVSNACAGNYQLSLRDANNCLLEQAIELSGPALHALGMEDSTYYICQGQKVNISLPEWTQHNWSSTNGFNSQSVAVFLTEAGDYSVTAMDASGCMSRADFKVIYSTDLLKAEFLVPKETYVGDTIVCVNLSLPQPDSWTWNFDRNKIVSLNQQGIYQQLVFLQEGEYILTLISHLGGCVAEQSKKVIVMKDKSVDENPFNLGYKEKGIKTVNVFPNPSDGHFKCEISLYEQEEMNLKVMNAYGQILAEQNEQAANDFLIPFDMQVPSGDLYWLLISTETDRKVVKILVK